MKSLIKGISVFTALILITGCGGDDNNQIQETEAATNDGRCTQLTMNRYNEMLNAARQWEIDPSSATYDAIKKQSDTCHTLKNSLNGRTCRFYDAWTGSDKQFDLDRLSSLCRLLDQALETDRGL